MGLITNLKAVPIGAAQEAESAVVGGDLASMNALAIVKASELIVALNAIVSALPGGDPNITPLNNLITSLS